MLVLVGGVVSGRVEWTVGGGVSAELEGLQGDCEGWRGRGKRGVLS